MKYVALLFFFYGLLSLNAQGVNGRAAGGNSQMRPQGTNQQRSNSGIPRARTEFKASNAAGIVYYDVKKVLKRLKTKNNKTLDEKIVKSLSLYNTAIKKIEQENRINLDTLNVYANLKTKNTEGIDNDIQKKRESVRLKIRPIRREVMKNEMVLNETFSVLLDEKQLKKWRNYQKEVKNVLKPQNNREFQNSKNSNSGFQRNYNQQRTGTGNGGGRQR